VSATPEEVAARHAFYTKRSLALYDVAIERTCDPSAAMPPVLRVDFNAGRTFSRSKPE